MHRKRVWLLYMEKITSRFCMNFDKLFYQISIHNISRKKKESIISMITVNITSISFSIFYVNTRGSYYYLIWLWRKKIIKINCIDLKKCDSQKFYLNLGNYNNKKKNSIFNYNIVRLCNWYRTWKMIFWWPYGCGVYVSEVDTYSYSGFLCSIWLSIIIKSI